MRLLLALFTLIALVLTPLAPAMASSAPPDHCAAMTYHRAPDAAAATHQCCTSAIPSLPDRPLEAGRPAPPTPPSPVAGVAKFTVSKRPHIELRPPRAV